MAMRELCLEQKQGSSLWPAGIGRRVPYLNATHRSPSMPQNPIRYLLGLLAASGGASMQSIMRG